MFTFRQITVTSILCFGFMGCAQFNDNCRQPAFAKGIVKFLNAKVGKTDGPTEAVVSIEGLSLSPSRDGVIRNDSLSCNGTLNFKSGKQELGVVNVYDPGADDPLDVRWKPATNENHATPETFNLEENSDLKKRENSLMMEELESTQQVVAKCELIGGLYETVAHVRNANRSPETALSIVQGMPIVSLEEKKSIINIVYFDPAFEGAGGYALRNQMADICIKKNTLRKTKNFQPLR